MKLQIDPLDNLFFRDGRPFTMGEETFAEGIFPPLPSTVLGAFRSDWISKNIQSTGQDVADLAIDSRKIRLAFSGLAIDEKAVFPMPFDLFLEKEDKNDPDSKLLGRPMDLTEKAAFSSSCPTEVSHLFLAPPKKTETIAGRLLDLVGMEKYLAGGQNTDFKSEKLSDSIHREHKLGIARDSGTNRTADGMLFRLLSNRLEDGFGEKMEDGKKVKMKLSLLAELSGFDAKMPDSSVIALGGERRAAMVKTNEFELPDCPKIDGLLVKIILLTPAPLDSWFPNLGGKLVAAAIGKPVLVGGWDYEKNKPKPMRRAVSAGSVFIFKVNDNQKAELIKLHGKSICEPMPNKFHPENEGFGLCFIANPFKNQQTN